MGSLGIALNLPFAANSLFTGSFCERRACYAWAMSVNRQHRQPYIFVVRLWLEPRAGAEAEVRGRVQCVGSGEVIYFRTWTALVTFFETALVTARPPPALDDDHSVAPDDG